MSSGSKNPIYFLHREIGFINNVYRQTYNEHQGHSVTPADVETTNYSDFNVQKSYFIRQIPSEELHYP